MSHNFYLRRRAYRQQPNCYVTSSSLWCEGALGEMAVVGQE